MSTADRRCRLMPKQGFAGLAELFRDLWRELTPVVRVGLFAGLGLGLALGLTYVLRLPPDYARLVGGNRVEYRTVLMPRVAIVVGIAILGGLLGTAAGVTFEMVFGKRDGEEKKPRRRRGKSSQGGE
jgi:hypothetical protein